MTIERRIFVVGVPRSGTTLLQSLLAVHEDVASTTESHFFDRHFRPVPGCPARAILVRDPDLEVTSFFQANDALWEDGDPVRWVDDPPSWLLRLPLLLPAQADAMARRLVEILDDLALCQGRTAWVEKTPGHLRYVPFLERVLGGDAGLHFVHVIRDGLDTVASLHLASAHWERHYGLDECVTRWNREMALSLSRARSPRDHFVFYEDFTADPETTIRRLLGDLGLPWQPDILSRYAEATAWIIAADEEAWKADVGRAIERSSASRDRLTTAQRQRIEGRVRRDLYDRLRESAVPSTTPSPLRAAGTGA